MSLTATMRQAVKTALTAVGDIVTTITYTQVTIGAFDAVTDTRTDTETVHSNVPCALVRARTEEVTWTPVRPDVQKALIAYSDLSIVPALTDYLTIDGVRWEIAKIRPLPGTPLHVLFIQAP